MRRERGVVTATSVGGAVELAAHRLAAAGLAAPRRDAVRLVSDLLDLERAAWWAVEDRALDPAEQDRIDRAVAARVAGAPLAYATGVVGFRHLTLRSDRRALIPRPETEGLVDWALRLQPTGVAADIGTGSGCLALALRDEGDYRAVIGVDWSAEVLALAAMNSRMTERPIELVRGDLVAPLGASSIDILVSNPPYLSEEEYRMADPAVRDHEPRLALASGTDGLTATRALLDDARRVVRPGGWIVIELAADRAVTTGAMAASLGWVGVHIENDFFGRPRYLVARREEGIAA